MAYNYEYPYTDSSRYNDDWLLATVNEMVKSIDNFINLNTIKYANPILWDITSQYEANTVVIDGHSGNAFISIKAVPAGVHLNNSEYWTQIYNYADVVDTLRSQLASNEEESTTATKSYSINDLVFVNGLLYRVIAPMIAGDSFVADSNIIKTTIDEELKLVRSVIDTLQDNIDAEAIAREDADGVLQDNIDAEALARETADNDIIDMINNIDVNHVYNQALPTADITTNIGLKEGTYNITEDTTINAQLVVPKGAILNIDNGVTLTINGQILAGRYQIFSGNGAVVVNKSYQCIGFPEWFGAVSNDNNVDSTSAIQKCINTFDITELTEAGYYVSSTIVLNAPNKTLRGMAQDNVAHTTDKTAMLIYPSNYAGVGVQIGSVDNAIAERPFGIGLRNLTITNYLSNSHSGSSKGVTVATVQSCTVENVNIRAFHIGLEVINASYSWFKKIITSAPENDNTYIGINIPANNDITYTGIGTNSTVIFEEIAVNGLDGNSNYGFKFDKGYGLADTFVYQLECYGCKYGVYADFDAANATQRNQNIFFNDVRFDYSEFGFYFLHDANVNPYRPTISINNPYIEMRTASTPSIAFAFNYGKTNSYGGVTTVNGGIVTGAGPHGIGVGGYGVNGAMFKGTVFRELTKVIDMSTDTDVNLNNVFDIMICQISGVASLIKCSSSNCKYTLALTTWGGIGSVFDESCNFKNSGIDATGIITAQLTNGLFGANPSTLTFTDVFTKNAGGNWYIN